jgi:DHA3 family macrolide efflux protein-like MFS transporter
LLKWDFSTFLLLNLVWGIAFTVGMPVVAKQNFGGSISAYGFLIAAYGIGSVVANLVLGNTKGKRSQLLVCLGHMIWSAVFFVPALTQNLELACLGLAIGALGSPMVNLTVLTLIQSDIVPEQIGRVYSLRATIAFLGLALGVTLAGPIFDHFPASQVLAFSGAVFLFTGLLGLVRFWNEI